MTGFRETPRYLGTKKRAVLFLRWVVIIVTSYLLLYSPRSDAPSWTVPAFVVLFLASNLLAGSMPEEAFEEPWFQACLVLLDTMLISAGMVLAGERSAELFLLYFSVLFLAALGENLAMIVGGCLLIVIFYVLVLARTGSEVLTSAVLLRFPFLFAIATFYGYLIEVAKSERRRAELAVAQEKFRTDFLATLTHDLQSPLSAIAGFSDILLDAPAEEPLREYRRVFEAVRRGARECSELIANFLAIVRGEARAHQLRRQVVDLASVVEEVHQLHETTARQKDVRVQLALAEGLPALSGDRMQIRRAVSNLLGNAIKFAPQGGQVDVTTARDGSALVLTVADNGPGIPVALQSQLFERYARGEGNQTGSGLGLFIVRLVAEAHGGSVIVDSRPGRGARFTIRLPLPVDAPLPATQPEGSRRVSTVAAETRSGEDGEGTFGKREVLS
ncbi:MAG: sensor histidine kinase [Candidatus Binatia bacterium]